VNSINEAILKSCLLALSIN
jgi:hypothetical protein